MRLVNQKSRKIPIKIALEGLDGSGKSTQVSLIAQALAKKNIRIAVYRYTATCPGKIGSFVHYLYKSNEPQAWYCRVISRSRMLQELLFAKQARNNYKSLGDPDTYDVIIFDRSAVTAYVVHVPNSFLSGFWEKLLLFLEKPFVPDYVIYLDIPIETSTQRLLSRGGCCNDEQLTKLFTIRANYDRLLSGSWSPKGLKTIRAWFRIDATPTEQIVLNNIIHHINQVNQREALLVF